MPEVTTAPALQTPEVLQLTVTPAAFNLIRQGLGAHPYDQVGALIAQLEQQAQKQVIDFNAPKVAPAPAANEGASISSLKTAVKRAAIAKRPFTKKKAADVVSISPVETKRRGRPPGAAVTK